MSDLFTCASCGASGLSIFHEVHDVPVHSVQLLRTRQAALAYPAGDIQLGFCSECGFISNAVFDPQLHDYSAEYESTQSCSPTFSAFHRRLAQHLIERYDLYGKEIIEIGCGQGEFLILLCELGGNRGVGFDPAYDSQRLVTNAQERIEFVKDFYSEKYAHYHGDFVCCKMTLEHIPNTAEFVSTVRRSVGDRADTIVFFQVPDVTRILREQAFWDIYYEHCSYFSLGSLARLFRRCGFDVIDLWSDYGDQYLMVEARPGRGDGAPPLPQEDDLEMLAQDVARFSVSCQRKLDRWKRNLQELRKSERRVALWGGGSKAVAFLTTLGLRDEIEYVVDINPLKHGTYLAGTGQEVVAPAFLKGYRPDVVIAMNPVYCKEIQRDLDRMGLTAELAAV
jgi:SAM-dependent methyltransferase